MQSRPEQGAVHTGLRACPRVKKREASVLALGATPPAVVCLPHLEQVLAERVASGPVTKSANCAGGTGDKAPLC